MYHFFFAGCGSTPRYSAALILVLLSLALLPRDLALEPTSEDDLAECDDVGLSQLPQLKRHRARIQQQVHGRPSLAESTKAESSPASAGQDSHGHGHGGARSHHQKRRLPQLSVRRRRRQSTKKKPAKDPAFAASEASKHSQRTGPPVLSGSPSAATPDTGLTFIQIGSSINETKPEEIVDDYVGPPPPPSNASTSGIALGDARVLREAPSETYLFGGPDRMQFGSLAVGMFTLALSLSAMAARFIFHGWMQHRLAQGGIREKAEKLKVTHSAELEDMFPVVKGAKSEMKSGVLMRIQGRVVSESQGSLVAPLSGQQCVMYSASISHQRHDGIHQPVAFRSESTDFAIEMRGSPNLRITVHSHDVGLFDMVGGKLAREHTLAEAPDAWRAFLLAHCVPGQDASSGVALGPDDSLLDFRESALDQGVEVTCIGEIARDRNGNLSLYPWRPTPNKVAPGGLLEFVREDVARKPTLSQEVTARIKSFARSIWPQPSRRESLVGRVMISDDPSFLD